MKKPPASLTGRLLASSPDLLQAEGVPRFEEIADMVGVSRATLYYYFSGQDDLLGFLLIAHVEEGASVIAAADPGTGSFPGRLHAVIKAIVGYLGERPGVCSGLLTAAAGSRMREVLEVNDSLIAAPIRHLITAGGANGDFQVDEASDAANAIMGAVLMAVLGRASQDRNPRSADFREAVADQIVRGLSAQIEA